MPPKDKLSHQVAQLLARISQPHLSRKYRRTPAIDWRSDPIPPPHLRPFVQNLRTPLERETELLDMRRPYRILSLDGGGVRGILTTKLLERIHQHNPQFLDQVDFVCGTSAGGILSLLLAANYSPKECSDIYSWASSHIFGYDPWRSLSPFKAKYCDKAKEDIMKMYFGERTMDDLEKTCAVVAFRLDGAKSKTHSFFNKEGWRPAVFSNMPIASGLVAPDSDLKVWDAAMRTSAAPTFFPVYKGYTDGGIVANNPSVIGVTKAMAHYPNVSIRNVVVLSVGAGYYPRHTNIFSTADQGNLLQDRLVSRLEHADWGIKQWLPFLLDLLLDGDSITIEMVMHYLLGNNGLYHRLEPRLPSQIALDDVNSMKDLAAFADTVDLSETFKFVDENFSFDDLSSVDDTMITNSLDHASCYHKAWESVSVQSCPLKIRE